MDKQGKEKIKLLLVEDDDDFSSALVSRLAKRNFAVTTAISAEDALHELTDTTVDVVVADIKLPGMDGMRLLVKVRELYDDLPVILLTGYGSLESAKEAVRLNATDYLLKPLETIDDLLNPVHKAVHSYRLFRENKQLMHTLQTKMDELGRSERKYRDLFESASDIIYTVDSQGIITSVNKRMEQITKYKKRELIGKPATKLIASLQDEMHEIKSQEILAGKSLKTVEVKIATKDGKERVGEMGMRPIREDGKIIGVQCIVHDITERKKAQEQIEESLREKELLLKEIHHRVKNNMQIISSLLSLQSNYFKDQNTLEAFKESRNRVRSMALVHEKLYQSHNLARVDFAEYVRAVTNSLYRSHGVDHSKIALKLDVETISFGIDVAIPCGLIINELVSNALRYAFPPSWKGKCQVEVKLHSMENNEFVLVVSDNGVGMPQDLNFRDTETLGLRLVTILAEEQLQGNIESATCPRRFASQSEAAGGGKGTRFQIKFRG